MQNVNVTAKTFIFASYKEFMAREDKNVNGVSETFAEDFPHYEDMNTTNIGCWNCTECYGCVDCAECAACEDCADCFFCTLCYDSVHCVGCDQCRSCVDCNDCTLCSDLCCVVFCNMNSKEVVGSMERVETETPRYNFPPAFLDDFELPF